jgi:hypothetical protein
MNPNEEEKNQHRSTLLPSNIKIPHQPYLTFTDAPSSQLDTPVSNVTILTLDSFIPKTPLITKIRIFKQIVTSRKAVQKKLPLEAARLSIVLFFLGYFFAFQPYDHSLAHFISNANGTSKIVAEMVLIAFLLITFYCLNRLAQQPVSQRFKSSAHEKRKKIISIITLAAMMVAQSLLIVRLFMHFIVQYLAPVFFALSVIGLVINCILNPKNGYIKAIFLLCFLAEILGITTIFLNTPGIKPSFTDSVLWKNDALPIVLIISFICASITTLEPCCVLYYENMANISYMSNQTSYNQSKQRIFSAPSSKRLSKQSHQPREQTNNKMEQLLQEEINDNLSLTHNSNR